MMATDSLLFVATVIITTLVIALVAAYLAFYLVHVGYHLGLAAARCQSQLPPPYEATAETSRRNPRGRRVN